MLATVYRYLGKKDKHLGTVGVREREGKNFWIKKFCGGTRENFS
jgi:hypothetical protein